MKLFFAPLMLVLILVVPGTAFQTPASQAHAPGEANLAGRWRVKFNLTGVGDKTLIFEPQAKGYGSFLLLDAGPDNAAALAAVPATWSRATNDRVNFSGEVELPIGTCCRETGTLILKGKFKASNSIVGTAIFIGSTTDDENFNGYRSMTGTFTATQATNN